VILIPLSIEKKKAHLPAGLVLPKSKTYYDRQSVGQSVLVSGTHLGPATNFSNSPFDYFLEIFGFVVVGGLL
jgi:hypothetical protein